MNRLTNAAELKVLRDHLVQAHDPNRPIVRVCRGPGVWLWGAGKVSQAFQSSWYGKRSGAAFKASAYYFPDLLPLSVIVGSTFILAREKTL